MMDTETELASDAGDFTAPGDPWLHLPENVRFGLSLDGSCPNADILDCLFGDDADRRDVLAAFASDAYCFAWSQPWCPGSRGCAASAAVPQDACKGRPCPSIFSSKRATACYAFLPCTWFLPVAGFMLWGQAMASCLRLAGHLFSQAGIRSDHEAQELQRWCSKLACVLMTTKAPAQFGGLPGRFGGSGSKACWLCPGKHHQTARANVVPILQVARLCLPSGLAQQSFNGQWC